MRHYISISFILASFMAAGTLRAATKPHAGPAPAPNGTWTNEDLQRLNKSSLFISVVGQPANEVSQGTTESSAQPGTEDPAWYAEQAASLNARLEDEQADLRKFTQALDDARELKSTTGGVDLAGNDLGITPEATIEILQNRIRETQSELDALEDVARHNSIPPGILRGGRDDGIKPGLDLASSGLKQKIHARN